MTILPVESTNSEPRRFAESLVLWSRRGTAVAFNVWLIVSVAIRDWWMPSPIASALASIPLSMVPRYNVGLAVAVLWYAFLSQLKIRWAVFLPAYLLLFPVFKVTCFVARPAARSLKSVFEPQPSPKRAAVPVKRIWLLLFFIWLVSFRGLNLPGAAWILPVLAVPVWLFFLKLAYKTAVAPVTFVKLMLELSQGLLDTYMKQLRDAKPGDKKTTGFGFVQRIVASITTRYSSERVVSVIHREAIAAFSMTLLLAITASACFWGLVARALIMSTSTTFVDSYRFFSSRSGAEAVLWAFGCMTTTVDMPAAGSPVWVKAVHALVLLTGLFQMTYLLACFSIMASAESGRIASEASKLLQATESKLRETKDLEVITLSLATISSEPAARQ